MVNNPNLPLDAPTLHSRQAAVAKREAAVERAMNRIAQSTVDQAILNGWVPSHAREYHVNVIRQHADGIEAGIDAFEAFVNTSIGAGAASHASRFTVPRGYHAAPGERLALHSRVSEVSRSQGITYREALPRIPGPVSAGPIPVGVDLNAKMAYEQIKASVERTLATAVQVPMRGLLGRAKRVAEIAEDFASAGRWRDAFRAIDEARRLLDALDRLEAGHTSDADYYLRWPEPTPATVGKTYAELQEAGLWPSEMPAPRR